MQVAEDRARWREVGEAYIQHWTGSGVMMMMIPLTLDTEGVPEPSLRYP
jgi:hypothetical protein